MNTTDMYAREKSNQAHLDEMRRNIHGNRLLEGAASDEAPARAELYRRLIPVLASATVAIVLIGLAVAATSNGVTGAVPFIYP